VAGHSRNLGSAREQGDVTSVPNRTSTSTQTPTTSRPTAEPLWKCNRPVCTAQPPPTVQLLPTVPPCLFNSVNRETRTAASAEYACHAEMQHAKRERKQRMKTTPLRTVLMRNVETPALANVNTDVCGLAKRYNKEAKKEVSCQTTPP